MEDEVTAIDRMAKLTKADVVAFANKYLDGSELCRYLQKAKGKILTRRKMTKPSITPIVMNRDVTSDFLSEIQNSNVKPIEPVFLDFKKDLSQLKAKSNIPVLYKQNTSNDLFQLIYVFDMGNNNDKVLGTAFDYIDYLGTSDMTPEQLKSEFYRLACTFRVVPGNERTYVLLSGLNENMPEAMKLFEKLMADAQVNKEAYTNMVADILKSRKDAKLNQMQNFRRLMSYGMYGPEVSGYQYSDRGRTTEHGSTRINRPYPQSEQLSTSHSVLWANKRKKNYWLSSTKSPGAQKKLKEIPVGNEFPRLETPVTQIFIAPYEAKQIYMTQLSNRGDKFDPMIEPSARCIMNTSVGV